MGGFEKIEQIIKQSKYQLPPGVSLHSLTEAETYDNEKNLDEQWLATLEVIKIVKPAIYRRFVLNSWEEETEADIIINRIWVERAVNRVIKTPNVKVIYCDPAGGGKDSDETVIGWLEGYKQVKQKVYTDKNPMQTVGLLMRDFREFDADGIAVDEGGLGLGITSRLTERPDMINRVLGLNSGEGSVLDNCNNFKTELWYEGSEKFRQGLVSIIDDDKLKEQLSIVKYKTIKSSGELQVESKKDTKKRLKCSPDRADGLLIGLHGVDFFGHIKKSVKADLTMVFEHVSKAPTDPQTIIHRKKKDDVDWYEA